jgi:RNA polymerase sigma-70 factor (ECF subfamily)
MDRESADVCANPATTEQASRNVPDLDRRLLAQIGQRDEQALRSLYDRYSTLVYSIALRITQQPALAETIVQNVFRTVWQSAIWIPVDVNVRVWLSGMTRQQALAAQDSRTRVAAQQETCAMGCDEQHAGGAQALKVRRALDGLLPEQRETIELAYYGGLSCREIAQRMHEPVSIIKARLRVGLSTLSEQLSTPAAHLEEPNL